MWQKKAVDAYLQKSTKRRVGHQREKRVELLSLPDVSMMSSIIPPGDDEPLKLRVGISDDTVHAQLSSSARYQESGSTFKVGTNPVSQAMHLGSGTIIDNLDEFIKNNALDDSTTMFETPQNNNKSGISEVGEQFLLKWRRFFNLNVATTPHGDSWLHASWSRIRESLRKAVKHQPELFTLPGEDVSILRNLIEKGIIKHELIEPAIGTLDIGDEENISVSDFVKAIVVTKSKQHVAICAVDMSHVCRLVADHHLRYLKVALPRGIFPEINDKGHLVGLFGEVSVLELMLGLIVTQRVKVDFHAVGWEQNIAFQTIIRWFKKRATVTLQFQKSSVRSIGTSPFRMRCNRKYIVKALVPYSLLPTLNAHGNIVGLHSANRRFPDKRFRILAGLVKYRNAIRFIETDQFMDAFATGILKDVILGPGGSANTMVDFHSSVVAKTPNQTVYERYIHIIDRMLRKKRLAARFNAQGRVTYGLTTIARIEEGLFIVGFNGKVSHYNKIRAVTGGRKAIAEYEAYVRNLTNVMDTRKRMHTTISNEAFTVFEDPHIRPVTDVNNIPSLDNRRAALDKDFNPPEKVSCEKKHFSILATTRHSRKPHHAKLASSEPLSELDHKKKKSSAPLASSEPSIESKPEKQKSSAFASLRHSIFSTTAMIPRSKRNKSFKQKVYNPSIVVKTGVKKINGKVVETCDYDKNALESRRHLELSDSTKSLTNGKTKEVMSNANASIPSTEKRFIPDDHLLKGFEVQRITATQKIVVERWNAEANEYVKEEIVAYRVRWKGFPDDINDTWVESKFITNDCIEEYRRWLGFLATAAYDLTLRNVLLESAELKMMIEKNILTQQSSNHPNLRIYLENTNPSTNESPGPEEIKAAKPRHKATLKSSPHHPYHRGAKQWRKQNLVRILLSIVLKKDLKKGHTHELWTKYGGNDKHCITILQIASFCSNRGRRSRDRFGPFMSTLLMRIFFFKLSTDDYGNAYLRKKDTIIDKDNDGAVKIARVMEENHPSGRNSVRVSVKDDDGVIEADLIAEGVMALKKIYWECGGSRLKLKNLEGAETVENIAFKEKILRAAGVGCRPVASFITAAPSKRILSLNMSGCGIVCKSFPDAIGNLIFLEDLDLSNNKGMCGRIPEAIGRLTNLKTIKFQDCFSLTGSIPRNFCRLLKLRTMDFQNCGGINGELPQYLGELEFLQVISFVGCYRLTGAIPPKVGTLKYLKYFGIAHCQKLTGTIPVALGTVSTLEVLNVQGCKNLHGTLPLCLCGPSLEFSNIKYVDFSGCTSLDTSSMACERDVYRKILDDPC